MTPRDNLGVYRDHSTNTTVVIHRRPEVRYASRQEELRFRLRGVRKLRDVVEIVREHGKPK